MSKNQVAVSKDFEDKKSLKKRSFTKMYDSSIKFDETSLHQKRECLSTEKTEFEGKILSQSVFITDNPDERYKGLKASDFALENILEQGSEQRSVKCSLNSFEIESQLKSALQK